MKKYTRPTVEIIELQSREAIAADVNPIKAATSIDDATGTVTTVYNLSLSKPSSQPQA